MTDLDLPQLVQAAARSREAGDLGRAEALCRQILEHDRKNANAFVLLGQVALDRSRFAEAGDHFRRCLKLVPGSAETRVLLGGALARQGRHREALDCYDKALKVSPDLPMAVAGKGDLHFTRGQYAKARSVLAPFVERGGEPMLAVLLANVEYADGDAERAAAVAAGVERDGLAPALAYQLGSVEGKAHERLGDVEKAFEAWTRGNGAIETRFDVGYYERLVDGLIEVFGPDAIADLPRAAGDTSRAVFVAGMPRSGTTLLDRILDAHPRACGVGELNLVPDRIRAIAWDIGSSLEYPACLRDLDQDDVDRFSREHLEGLTAIDRHADRVADKNPHNAFHLGLISLMLPQARVLHCVRDPLDTCLSCWAEALEPAVHPYSTSLADLGFVYRQYERLMAHWRAVLPVDVLDVSYETLIDDQEAQTRRIVEHCGLEWDDRCLRYHETKRAAVTLSHAQVRRPMYRTSVGRAERFGALLDPLREALAG
jgi:Flp pilus assembly protein TadD